MQAGEPCDLRLADPRGLRLALRRDRGRRGSRAAGAVVVGRTNMDEFAMGSSTENSAYGADAQSVGSRRARRAARRAARPRRSPRASCRSRSAATPAARSASRRRFCGVVGLKPTYGRVSRYGLVAFASSLDQIGPFARTVARLRARCSRRSPATTRATRPRCPSRCRDCAAALDGDVAGLVDRAAARVLRRGGRRPRGARARARGGRASSSARARRLREVSLPHTRVRDRDLLPDRDGRGVEQPRPLRRRPLRPPRGGRARPRRDVPSARAPRASAPR